MAAKRRPAFIPCTPPPDEPDPVLAARAAVEENPANAPPAGALMALAGPQFIAVATSKYWGPQTRTLSVRFLDSPTAACRRLILEHMNAWSARIGISFAETGGQGDIRISRGAGGYWSYLGTDVRQIAAGRPTMNLQGFTETTSAAEYRRVVRHETGHTLGCPHEHMRRALVELLDANKTIAYFRQTQGWSRETTIQQVLTPVEEQSLMRVEGGPVVDDESIMCYQLPGSITKSGRPIPGGRDIIESDFAYMSRLYPKADAPPPPPPPATGYVSLPVAEAAAVEALRKLGYTVTK